MSIPQTPPFAASAQHAGREVLITWPDYDVEHRLLGGALRDAGLALRLAPKRGDRTPAELRSLAKGCVGAIVSTDPFDANVLAAVPSLRVLARVGIGVDSIDLDAASAAGVVVTVTPGANETSVADHAIALMLAVLRRIVEHDGGVRRGEWNRTGPHTPLALTGATVGLVGYGCTGRLVGMRLQGFGVRLLASDPRGAAATAGDAVELVTLDELLAAADVVSLHLPFLATTRGLIGARELALMQADAVIVNTARGGIVEEEALIDALERGRIRGAGLDVFEREPPHASHLLSLPNVVVSPHVAGLSEQSVHEMTRRATESVLDVLAGRSPRDCANSAALGATRPPTPLLAGADDA